MLHNVINAFFLARTLINYNKIISPLDTVKLLCNVYMKNNTLTPMHCLGGNAQ